jgi:hypothetical protein
VGVPGGASLKPAFLAAILVMIVASPAILGASAAASGLPRHPPPDVLGPSGGLEIISREYLIAALWKGAAALSESLETLYERSGLYSIMGGALGLDYFPDTMIVLNVNSSIAAHLGLDRLPGVLKVDDIWMPKAESPLAPSEPGKENYNTTYKILIIDYLSVESIILDAAKALEENDSDSFQSIVLVAMLLYSAYMASARFPNTGVEPFPISIVSIPGPCASSLGPAVYAVINNALWDGVNLEYLKKRTYTSAFLHGTLGGESSCTLKRRTSFFWPAPATYVNAARSSAFSVLGLLARLVPLGPEMDRFILLPTPPISYQLIGSGGYAGSSQRTRGGSPAWQEAIHETTTQSGARSQVGLGSLNKLAGDLAPEPSSLAVRISSIAGNVSHAAGGNSVRVSAVNISSALRLARPALSSVARPFKPSIPSPLQAALSLPGATRYLKYVFSIVLIGALAYLALRMEVHRALLRSIKNIYAGMIVGARIRNPLELDPVACYKAALRLAAVYAGPKSVSETPREYLVRASRRLPPRIRGALRRATRLYEDYRYAGRKIRGGCEL